MPPVNPRLELLPQGQTLLTWEIQQSVARNSFPPRLQFSVRLDPAAVERLVEELGPERAVYVLWTHFRCIPGGQGTIDSERVSLDEWMRAVDTLLAEMLGDV